MIDRTHALPLTRQAEVLKLSRSSLYYRPRPVSPADLEGVPFIAREQGSGNRAPNAPRATGHNRDAVQTISDCHYLISVEGAVNKW